MEMGLVSWMSVMWPAHCRWPGRFMSYCRMPSLDALTGGSQDRALGVGSFPLGQVGPGLWQGHQSYSDTCYRTGPVPEL
jgi:hypothetical protein